MIVADPAMVALYALVERLAPASLAVLVTGETGCGKELVAKALHARSPRSGKPLIALNCAALHASLAESELFGHEKGAFSGALASHEGLIEAASGSTLFLDEVGELAPLIQAKLLRVLESRRVTRVGDVREREVDVRLISATNRNLLSEVDEGRFRRDLYYRISAATLDLPPLRERLSELPKLALAFLEEAGRPEMSISDAAMSVLSTHSWPGNIRELKNLMHYLGATLTGDVVLPRDISFGKLAPMRQSPPGEFRPLAEEVRALEMRRIHEALEATGGNQTKAALLLSVPLRTFFEKAKHYGLTPKRKKDAARNPVS